MEYIIQDKQQFRQYQEAFRQLSRSKQATVEDHILYNLIRGKDLKRGFTPITSEKKLNAHYSKNAWLAFDAACNNLAWNIRSKHSTFKDRYGETITTEQWDKLLVAVGGGK
jgi:hypothetical protein